MVIHQDVVSDIFGKLVNGYCHGDAETILHFYTPEPDLLFWNAEEGVVCNQKDLEQWYRELFAQFEIQSAKYQILSVYGEAEQIACASLWVFSTRQSGGEGEHDDRCFRATHIFRQYEGCWRIAHLHASNLHKGVTL